MTPTGFEPAISGVKVQRPAVRPRGRIVRVVRHAPLCSLNSMIVSFATSSGLFMSWGGRDRTYDICVPNTECYHCTTPQEWAEMEPVKRVKSLV